MPALILPSRFARQPQQAATVDWSNPGSRVLRAAAIPGIAEAVSNTLARPVVGAPVLGTTTAGRAWAFASTALDIPGVAYVAPPFSLLVVVKKSDLIADALVSFGGIGTGRGWKFGSGGAATTARLTYGGVADYNLATGFWDIDGGVTIAMLVVAGTTAKLFKPSGLVATSTVGTPSTTLPTRPLTIGAGYNGSVYSEASTSAVNFVELFGRALSDTEAMAMVSQVYQLVNPPTRRLFPAGIAAPASLVAVVASSTQSSTSAGIVVKQRHKAVAASSTSAGTSPAIAATQRQKAAIDATTQASSAPAVAAVQRQKAALASSTQAGTAPALTVKQRQTVTIAPSTQNSTSPSVSASVQAPGAAVIAPSTQSGTSPAIVVRQRQQASIGSSTQSNDSPAVLVRARQRITIVASNQLNYSPSVRLATSGYLYRVDARRVLTLGLESRALALGIDDRRLSLGREDRILNTQGG